MMRGEGEGVSDAPSMHDWTGSFPLEMPEVCVPWGTAESTVLQLLRGARVRGVGPGRLRARCRILGGLDADLEFRFRPRKSGRLVQVEFMRNPQRRRRQAFENLQELLVRCLGPGTPGLAHAVGDDGVRIVPCSWTVGSVAVTHDYHYQGAHYEKVLFSWAG